MSIGSEPNRGRAVVSRRIATRDVIFIEVSHRWVVEIGAQREAEYKASGRWMRTEPVNSLTMSFHFYRELRAAIKKLPNILKSFSSPMTRSETLIGEGQLSRLAERRCALRCKSPDVFRRFGFVNQVSFTGCGYGDRLEVFSDATQPVDLL